jgi:hypothetical protein
MMLEKQLELAEAAEPPPTPPEHVIEEAFDEHPAIRGLQADILADQVELRVKKLALQDPDGNPDYQKLATEIEQRQTVAAELRKELRAKIVARLKASQEQQREKKLAEMKAELNKRKLWEDTCRAQYDEEVERRKGLSGQTLDLEFARDDMALEEGVRQLIQSRITKLTTEQRAPDRVTLLTEAKPPGRPAVTPYMKMAVAASLAFCLPFVLAGLWTGLCWVAIPRPR